MSDRGKDAKRQGFGCMRLPIKGGAVDTQEMSTMVDAFLKAGFHYFDTAHPYHGGESEKAIKTLVGEALKPIRDKVAIATKCGVQFTGGHMVMDSRAETIRTSVEGSPRRLETDYVDLYYTHRVDPNVPIETVTETMAQRGQAAGSCDPLPQL